MILFFQFQLTLALMIQTIMRCDNKEVYSTTIHNTDSTVHLYQLFVPCIQ